MKKDKPSWDRELEEDMQLHTPDFRRASLLCSLLNNQDPKSEKARKARRDLEKRYGHLPAFQRHMKKLEFHRIILSENLEDLCSGLSRWVRDMLRDEQYSAYSRLLPARHPKAPPLDVLEIIPMLQEALERTLTKHLQEQDPIAYLREMFVFDRFITLISMQEQTTRMPARRDFQKILPDVWMLAELFGEYEASRKHQADSTLPPSSTEQV